MSAARLLSLTNDLLAEKEELPWLEFKHNNFSPEVIGVRISAISNAARLAGKSFGYMVWGVENGTHKVLGTTFRPDTETVKAEPLQFWLANRLQPDPVSTFHEVDHPDGRLVLLEIPAATSSPIEFDRTAYIRIGSATPRLSDHPERLRALWEALRPYAWETGVAAQYVTGDDVLRLIDYASVFELLQVPLPDNRPGIFDRLQVERLILADVGGHWNITNLGAILFAKDIEMFGGALARKAVRFVAYEGTNRTATVSRRQDGKRGYASGFQGLMDFINGLLPKNEHIGKALRTEAVVFPEIAVRELVANALIHQDMTITGTGPMIELFADRLEITNPGQPLISPERFIDSPPRSRNEALAKLMRRMKICEEQGSGIDKVVSAVELYQLPPPDFRVALNSTIAVLYAPRKFADMTADERIRACYQHSVLRFVSGHVMENSSLRERLGIEKHNATQVSSVFRATLEAGFIRYADPERPKSGYVPFWA